MRVQAYPIEISFVYKDSLRAYLGRTLRWLNLCKHGQMKRNRKKKRNKRDGKNKRDKSEIYHQGVAPREVVLFDDHL